MLSADARAPAMVLMEVLVAVVILFTAATLFLSVMRGAAHDLRQTRDTAAALALAVGLLAEAEADPPLSPRSGESGSLSWRLACTRSSSARSPRLAMIVCEAQVRRDQSPPITLSTAWAQPREAALPP